MGATRRCNDMHGRSTPGRIRAHRRTNRWIGHGTTVAASLNGATAAKRCRGGGMDAPMKTTMLDLVRAATRFSDSDRDVVAAVAYLVNSGSVVLGGSFAGSKIDLR
jgi:hypothetical protein